jgi:hypothetical protein
MLLQCTLSYSCRLRHVGPAFKLIMVPVTDVFGTTVWLAKTFPENKWPTQAGARIRPSPNPPSGALCSP